MRILYDNALDRASTVTASNRASASLDIANVRKEGKAVAYRSATTTPQVDIRWTAAEPVRAVVIPWANFSVSATIRVRGYTNVGDLTPLFDTGALASAVFSGMQSVRGLPAGVNSFVYGGYSSAAVWLSQAYNCKQVLIDFSDSGSSYVEFSRLLIGDYWQPSIMPEVGLTVGMADQTRNERAESGDMRSQRGARYRTMKMDLSMMKAADRAKLWDILRGNGAWAPFFISILPGGATDAAEEQTLQMYAKLPQVGVMTYRFVNAYDTSLEVEEM